MFPTATQIAPSTTPEGLQLLAAAVLRCAIQDLGTKKHRQDAARFLYSGECEILAGVCGLDYPSFHSRLQRARGAYPQRTKDDEA